MKVTFVFVLFLAMSPLALTPAWAQSQPQPQNQSKNQTQIHQAELLVRTLEPILAPFAKQTPNPNRSLQAELSLLAMTGAPQELIGTKIRLAVQYPDKFFLQGPILGQSYTICRNKKQFWIAPKEKAEALLSQIAPEGESQSKEKFKLGNLELPFNQAQLMFLPALFECKEYAEEPIGGVPCRILELNLLPELAQPLGIEQWQARLWIGPGNKLARLEVLKPGWHIVVGVDQLAFSPTLPDATFDPALAGEVLSLKGPRLKALLEALKESYGR